ncbi:MAG TPA: sigma-70 family RNA polymerase sigma factor [Verrucomicrobiales bacterium]|nr:sigma-70 family RNA polymerase sigma factor [Verrucomicrobiales bacterium]
MAAARKNTSKKTAKKKAVAKKRAPAKKKAAKKKTAKKKSARISNPISVISHIKQPGHARGSYGENSAINIYLKEIGQTPLLKPAEEVVLAARIKKGDEEAEQHLIKANLRLVVKIARDYDGLGLPLLDLIDEGNMGLMKAVKRFDPSKGGKLSTYGSWWIKQSIKRALANQSKTIRLPVHLVDKISKMRLASIKLQENLGREPTNDEIAEEMHLPPAKVSLLRSAAIRPASLDAPLGDPDEPDTLADVVEDDHMHTPYQDLEDKTVVAMLHKMLDSIDGREADILRYRFGFGEGGEMRTLEDVGVKFGVTRERVRQIQNIALGRLRRLITKFERIKDHH